MNPSGRSESDVIVIDRATWPHLQENTPMKTYHALLSACVALLLLTVMMGCNKKKADAPTGDGPMERTGEKLDDAAEKTGEAIDRAAEKTGEKLEEAGEKMQE